MTVASVRPSQEADIKFPSFDRFNNSGGMGGYRTVVNGAKSEGGRETSGCDLRDQNEPLLLEYILSHGTRKRD